MIDGKKACFGQECYLDVFVLMAGVSAFGTVCAIILSTRVQRLYAALPEIHRQPSLNEVSPVWPR